MLIGLHAAFVSLAETALALAGIDHSDDLFADFERLTTYTKGRNAGRPVNTLTLRVNAADGSVKDMGIRTPYDAFSRVVRGALRRFDYPRAHNITVVSRSQMVQAAKLWPVTKQATAVAEALGHYVHYEQNSSLIRRYVEFLDEDDLRDLLPAATKVAGDEALSALTEDPDEMPGAGSETASGRWLRPPTASPTSGRPRAVAPVCPRPDIPPRRSPSRSSSAVRQRRGDRAGRTSATRSPPPPGRERVTRHRPSAGRTTSDIDVALTRMGRVTGRVTRRHVRHRAVLVPRHG
jgi:hypothetical protein